MKEYPANYSPLNPFLSVMSFRPSRSIYNSLVNDGSFNLIEPPTLKALIDDVYKLNYNSIENIIELEKEVAKEADRFFLLIIIQKFTSKTSGSISVMKR
ncbi:hypothetical protein N9J10_02725 [Flavobacteriaceae bacterium]|nr:hypothetical protein [Flavobacteriaceae bacterium]